MTILLTEQQRREAVMRLVLEIKAVQATIAGINGEIANLKTKYPRGLYGGAKAKAMRHTVESKFVEERTALIERQAELLGKIMEHQRSMKEPVVRIEQAPSPKTHADTVVQGS